MKRPLDRDQQTRFNSIHIIIRLFPLQTDLPPEITNKPHVNMLASWYATYFLFQATIVPMICLIYNDEIVILVINGTHGKNKSP